jgi:hypothetical protein
MLRHWDVDPLRSAPGEVQRRDRGFTAPGRVDRHGPLEYHWPGDAPGHMPRREARAFGSAWTSENVS